MLLIIYRGFIPVKKLFVMVLVIVLAVCSVVSVSAAGITADEQRIIDALDDEIVFALGSDKLPPDYLNRLEDFLIKYDLTAEQVEEVLAKIDEVKAEAKDMEISKTDQINQSNAGGLVGAVEGAVQVVDKNASVNINSDRNLVIQFSDKSTVTFEKTTVKATGIVGNPIATVAAGVVLLAGVAYVVLASRKACCGK